MAVLFILRSFGNHDFGGQQQTRHRGCVLQSQTRDLGRIQNALLDQVTELTGGRVVTEGALAFLHAVQNDSGVFARILNNLTQRLFDRTRQDLHTDRLVLVLGFELVENLQNADEGNTAARHHAFLDGRTSRVQGVFDAGLLLFHLNFGGRTDLDHGDAAGELRNTLLQLLLVVVRSRFFGLRTDGLDASLDVSSLAGAVDNRGVLFLHDNLLGIAEI